MQTLKLIIPGQFWDSQLYKGRLYLFCNDGALDVIDWGSLIEEWPVEPRDKLALKCAFSRSDLLYGEDWKEILADPEVREVFEAKFTRLANTELILRPDKVGQFRLFKTTNPFPFPHADTTIHYDQFFTAGREGIFVENAQEMEAARSKKKARKIWDCGASSLDAYYQSLAIAAGDEGLFRWDFYERHGTVSDGRPTMVTKGNCTDCHWLYYSILGSSYSGGGEFTEFEKPEFEQGTTRLKSSRASGRKLSTQEILRDTGFAWGSKDRICSARDGSILISTYKPKTKTKPAFFGEPQRFYLADWKGEAVAGAVTSYGAIVECDNAIVIAKSNGDPEAIAGEPVNWRVFNRSRHYENQLHIVFENHLEIWSFNHDYLVDQKEKRFGFTHSESSFFRRA